MLTELLQGESSTHLHIRERLDNRSDENVRLAGGPAAVRYTILDATHRLKDDKLTRPIPSWGRFWRGVELVLRKVFFFLPEQTLEKIVRPKRWVKMFKKLFR